ncbi:MAG: hypothetical protein H0X37_00595 [Herpetosiphonaceae bacterium]|nr:hypothetical protein [Herpetosiphonaceae bacterium]
MGTLVLALHRVPDTEGIETFSTFVRTIIRDQCATLLVIDGLENLRAAVSDDIRFKHFLHELHAFGEASQCTTLLLSQAGDDAVVPGATMVDGLLMLRDEYVGLRAVRSLEVQKFRGSSYLRGQHLFDITDDGIVVHPRTETVLATPQASVSQRERLLLGIARLDGMLQGGLLSGSSTMLLGSPGSGKTLLGLHFLISRCVRAALMAQSVSSELRNKVLRPQRRSKASKLF